MRYSWGASTSSKGVWWAGSHRPAPSDPILTQAGRHHKARSRVQRLTELGHCFPIEFAAGRQGEGSTMSDDTGSPPVRVGPVTLNQALGTEGVRRVIVTVSYLFCLVGALACFGVIDDTAHSLSPLLSPTASLLAPALLAHRLWWVVMVGLGIYAAWMWLPINDGDPSGRALAYPSAIDMGLLG